MSFHNNSNSILFHIRDFTDEKADDWVASKKARRVLLGATLIIVLFFCASIIAGIILLSSLSAKWQYWTVFIISETIIWIVCAFLFSVLWKSINKLQNAKETSDYKCKEKEAERAKLEESLRRIQLEKGKNNAEVVDNNSLHYSVNVADLIGNGYYSPDGLLINGSEQCLVVIKEKQLTSYISNDALYPIKNAKLVFYPKKNEIVFLDPENNPLPLDSVMPQLLSPELLVGFNGRGTPLYLTCRNGRYVVKALSASEMYLAQVRSAILSLKILKGMLSIFKPWQLNQTEGVADTNIIILNFTLKTLFTISLKPLDHRTFDSVSLLGTKVDDWHYAYKANIQVDLNGMRELHDYLQGFDFDTRTPESVFLILNECWDKILHSYHSYSKDAQKDAVISDLKRKNEESSRRITKLEQEYAQLMANNQSLSSSTVALSDYIELEESYHSLLKKYDDIKMVLADAMSAQHTISSHTEAIPVDSSNEQVEESNNMQYYQSGYSMPDGAKFLSETSESLFTAGKIMTFSLVTRRISRAPLWVFSPNLILPNPLFANVLDSLTTEITLKRAFTVVGSQSTGKPKRIIPATVEPKDDGFVLVTPGKIVY